MPKVAIVQSNYTAGEISPRLFGRTDLAKYFNGAEVLLNFLPNAYGNARSRPGSYFVREVKDSSAKTRLIPFQFSTEQTYQLEFGNEYIRFYMDGGIIMDPDDPTIPYEIETTYLTADLMAIQFTQDADVMYIAHGDHSPKKLSRYGHTDWVLEEVDFTDGPYKDDNTTNIEITAAATTGTGVLLTASAPAWAGAIDYVLGDYVTNGGYTYKCLKRHTSTTFAKELEWNYWVKEEPEVFKQGHVGGLWAYKDGWGKIASYINPYKVTIDIMLGFTALSPAVRTKTTDWNEGAWSDENGYPACVSFFEQRLFWGSTEAQPQTVWGSYTGEYENMQAGDNDADALLYTVASGQVNRIRWIEGGRVLGIGTTGGVCNMSGGSSADPLSPSNVAVRLETSYGSRDILPEKIGNHIYYIQRNGTILREFLYSFEQDAFLAEDITLLSDHILKGGVVEMDYQQSPDNVLWMIREDGVLVTLTRQVQHEVASFARQIMGGSFGAGNAVVESVSVIPNDTTGVDEVWLIVKRTINGVTKRYVEYLTPLDWGDNDEDAYLVDCGLTYEGAATSTISGLDHLEGETVQVCVNGANHPDCVVTGGAISLEVEGTKIHVGLGYNSDLKTVRPEGGSAQGSSQGKIKRVYGVVARLDRTGSFKIGKSFDDLQPVSFRTGAMDMGAPPPLYTGDKELHPNTGWGTSGQLCIRRDQPRPMNLLALILKVETND